MNTYIPIDTLRRAERVAFESVDDKPGLSLQNIVEVFGPGFDRPAADGSGETWGTLYVVADGDLSRFVESCESYQILDSYGYEWSERGRYEEEEFDGV